MALKHAPRRASMDIPDSATLPLALERVATIMTMPLSGRELELRIMNGASESAPGSHLNQAPRPDQFHAPRTVSYGLVLCNLTATVPLAEDFSRSGT